MDPQAIQLLVVQLQNQGLMALQRAESLLWEAPDGNRLSGDPPDRSAQMQRHCLRQMTCNRRSRMIFHVAIHVCLYIYIYVDVYFHMCTDTYTRMYIHTYVHVYICTYMNVYMHAYVHIHIHIYMYMYIYLRGVHSKPRRCLLPRLEAVEGRACAHNMV